MQGSGHKKHVGKEHAKRHSSKKTTEQKAISRPAIRRLARKGGVKRIADEVYETARECLVQFIYKIIKDAVVFTESARRITVMPMDVVQSLKRHGKILYGHTS